MGTQRNRVNDEGALAENSVPFSMAVLYNEYFFLNCGSMNTTILKTKTGSVRHMFFKCSL